MKLIIFFPFLILLTLGIAMQSSAAPIGLTDFSGSETLIDFSDSFERTTSPVIYQGVYFTVLAGAGNTDLAAIDNWSAFFDDIPGASTGVALNDFTGTTQLRIEFPTLINRVGILLSTNSVTSWTMISYDEEGDFLEATNARMPGVTEAVFLGLESKVNISYIDIMEFSNNSLVTLFDDLRYESTTPVPVPEPSTLLISGLMLFVAARYRKKMKRN